MSVTSYETVTARTLPALASAVGAAIGLGKQPFGNPYKDGILFCQPVSAGTPAAAYVGFQESEIDVHVPNTGDTITLQPSSNVFAAAVNPTGTIAALTLNIAAGTRNGQRVKVTFLHIVTALTCGANLAGDNKALPTSAAVGDSIEFIWSNAKAKWERM